MRTRVARLCSWMSMFGLAHSVFWDLFLIVLALSLIEGSYLNTANHYANLQLLLARLRLPITCFSQLSQPVPLGVSQRGNKDRFIVTHWPHSVLQTLLETQYQLKQDFKNYFRSKVNLNSWLPPTAASSLTLSSWWWTSARPGQWVWTAGPAARRGRTPEMRPPAPLQETTGARWSHPAAGGSHPSAPAGRRGPRVTRGCAPKPRSLGPPASHIRWD